jgi:hypothetical protein
VAAVRTSEVSEFYIRPGWVRFTQLKAYRLATSKARVKRLVIIEHVSVPFARPVSGQNNDAQMGPNE